MFGGAVWHTPLDGLSLMVEYDSDSYAQEKAAGNFTPRSQVNYGLTYDVSDQARLGLDWLYGATLGGNFSLRLDPVHPQYPQKIEPPPPPVTVRTPSSSSRRWPRSWDSAIRRRRAGAPVRKPQRRPQRFRRRACGGKAAIMPISRSGKACWT